MPQIVAIILALGLVFVISSAHYLFTQFWNLGDVREVFSETKNELIQEPDEPNTNIGQWVEPIIEDPNSLLDTVIVSGPRNNEVINDMDQVTFKFRAKVYSESIGSKVVFETKISGIDSDWKETTSNSRTIQMESGVHKYTFSVRAKSGGFIDNTPAKRTFTSNLSY